MVEIKLPMIYVTVSAFFLLLNNASGVPLNNTICLSERVLKSTCLKTCGDRMCDFDSYCGEDGRCLYCSDADCKSPPPGCQISCLLRSEDFTKMHHAGNRMTTGRMEEAGIFSNPDYLITSLSFNITLLVVLCLTNREWIATNVFMKLSEWRNKRSNKNLKIPIVVNNSVDGQTALLVTGKGPTHSDDITEQI
ncbi:uncharacterized protein LOC125671791 [Ostrea edulis]|uniref:uncharacterized protein LOC125671791 n=1 Tax=Ostrea edulis TaxID=37623 RepID=UPI0024AEC83D|nr:uncharacterized protein LOC125671791 [Ostrea edulis]